MKKIYKIRKSLLLAALFAALMTIPVHADLFSENEWFSRQRSLLRTARDYLEHPAVIPEGNAVFLSAGPGGVNISGTYADWATASVGCASTDIIHTPYRFGISVNPWNIITLGFRMDIYRYIKVMGSYDTYIDADIKELDLSVGKQTIFNIADNMAVEVYVWGNLYSVNSEYTRDDSTYSFADYCVKFRQLPWASIEGRAVFCGNFFEEPELVSLAYLGIEQNQYGEHGLTTIKGMVYPVFYLGAGMIYTFNSSYTYIDKIYLIHLNTGYLSLFDLPSKYNFGLNLFSYLSGEKKVAANMSVFF